MATRIEPDLKFVNSVIASGGESLKKCFQCATCSVVCELAPERRPFPRKEMIWAQWGLKNKLVANPDVWLCHQCNDCSTHCPRDAKPGDVMAAVRKQSVVEYATPKFLAQWVGKPQLLPLLLGIPALLLVVALALKTPLESLLGPAMHTFDALIGRDGHHVAAGMQYANFFPHWLIIGFFSFFTGISGLSAMLGILKFWGAMRAADSDRERPAGAKGLISSIIKTVIDIVTHNKFSGCTTTKTRFLSHLGVFYGFVGLFIVTTWAVIVIYVLKGTYPFNLMNPMKLFGNISGIAMVLGSAVMIYSRITNQDEAGKSTNFDWNFVWALLIVGITGFATELLRFAQAQTLGYAVYSIHLVSVFFLLVYLPYSKFAHIMYRTVAMVYAEYSGRDIALIPEKTAEVK